MNNADNFGLSLTNENSMESFSSKLQDFEEIVTSGIFDGIPYLGDIIATYKGFMNIKDKIFFKKFLFFLKSYEACNYDDKRIIDFRIKIKEDREFRIKVTETLIDYVDSFKDYRKIEIYSNLFSAYIDGYYNWEHFLNLSDSLNKLINLNDLNVIPKIDTTEGKVVKTFNEEESNSEANLSSAGLVSRMSVWSSDLYPTKIGTDLYKYGFSRFEKL